MTKTARSTETQRQLDRYIGIPVLHALRPFKRRARHWPHTAKRIGLIQPTAVGDTIMCTGVIDALTKRYPGAEIIFFHGATNKAALPLLDHPVTACQCVFKDVPATVRCLRGWHLDILIDLSPWPRLTAMTCFMARAGLTVGFQSRKQYRHALFDIAIPHRSDRHETENLRAICQSMGENGPYDIKIRHFESLPPGLDIPLDRLVLLHPCPGGSRAREKSWPVERWRALAAALISEGWDVALTGTQPDDAVAQEILGGIDALQAPHARSLCGHLTLTELAALLDRARLLITVDTGVLHLASGLGCRLIALHGPTRSARWGARNAQAHSIDSPHPGAGFIHFGFERSDRGAAVMTAITVETVLAAARSQLA